ncbi:MAG: mobile mystery protein B [Saprospiraceae bacterium]
MGLELEYTKGQTPISEEEKAGLKIKSISTMGELDEFEQQNIEEAIEWTLRKAPAVETILSEEFVNLVHEKMFNNVWRWAGSYRLTNKNIGVVYYRIRQEVHNLMNDCKYWIENDVYPPDEIAIRFKHRLVSIHLFPNGNGRHSRLMGDILIEALNKKPFTWGSQTIDQNESRKEYIDALRAADKGDYTGLIQFSRK